MSLLRSRRDEYDGGGRTRERDGWVRGAPVILIAPVVVVVDVYVDFVGVVVRFCRASLCSTSRERHETYIARASWLHTLERQIVSVLSSFSIFFTYSPFLFLSLESRFYSRSCIQTKQKSRDSLCTYYSAFFFLWCRITMWESRQWRWRYETHQ